MDYKKTLEKQLQLLSKCSENNCPPDELAVLTNQMVNVVQTLETINGTDS